MTYDEIKSNFIEDAEAIDESDGEMAAMDVIAGYTENSDVATVIARVILSPEGGISVVWEQNGMRWNPVALAEIEKSKKKLLDYWQEDYANPMFVETVNVFTDERPVVKATTTYLLSDTRRLAVEIKDSRAIAVLTDITRGTTIKSERVIGAIPPRLFLKDVVSGKLTVVCFGKGSVMP